MLKSVLAAAALAAAAAPAAAQTNDFAQFDVSHATSLGETLVLCDRARLLANPPDPDAQRAFVQVDPDRFELALPPDFVRASGWYDFDLERAYDRLRARGLVDRNEVRAARERYPVPRLTRAERPTVSERRFLQAQSNRCGEIIRAASRR